jgi:uncharacterized membrane protein YjfL (UPF0719 family)
MPAHMEAVAVEPAVPYRAALPQTRSTVELTIIALNFAYAILGVVLMYASYRIIDHLTPQVDFPEELKRGNIAVAIFIAALFLSIAIIIGNALS